ncbi:response regulator [Mariniluteicoccus flavus]
MTVITPAPHRSASAPTCARVVVADGQPLFRHAIGALLAAQPDFEVVGEAGTGPEMVELVQELSPDLVILDPGLGVMDDLELVAILRAKHPPVRVVMLGARADDDQLLSAVRHGVNGYLLKDLHPGELFDQLRLVLQGQTQVAPSLVGRLVAALRETGCEPSAARANAPAPEDSLSHRELEILQLVAHGLSNKEIGRRLSITEGTVKNHVHNALHKLHMYNRIQAAAYIVKRGLGAPLN